MFCGKFILSSEVLVEANPAMGAQWFDYFCSFIESDMSWRIPLLMQCIIGAILAGGSLFMPESPRYVYHIIRYRLLIFLIIFLCLDGLSIPTKTWKACEFLPIYTVEILKTRWRRRSSEKSKIKSCRMYVMCVLYLKKIKLTESSANLENQGRISICGRDINVEFY